MKPHTPIKPRPLSSSSMNQMLMELQSNQLYISFGKRHGALNNRNEAPPLRTDGAVMPEPLYRERGEPEMVVVDTRRRLDIAEDYPSAYLADEYHAPLIHRGDVLLKSNRSSHSSDTSSAYSGSDALHSAQSSLDDQEVDLTGLMESAVDSDEEEELSESIEGSTVRDTVRECLEKDPIERTDCDIEVLLEFMQHLPAFANMTHNVRHALCQVMVYAAVEKAGSMVMDDGEEFDSWSVIVNGHVEIELPDGNFQELHMGDSFGINATMEKMHHIGLMRTKVDDCQFVLVAQEEYYRILHQGEENIRRHEENGVVVLVTEPRGSEDVVLRGAPEHLIRHLMADHPHERSYVEDFLLTYRTFITSPRLIANKLSEWYQDPHLKDKVTQVVLLWVNSHFPDFETDPEMMDFLETIESWMDKEVNSSNGQRPRDKQLIHQLRMLNLTCAAKARSRTVTLARSTRDEVLRFSILGGYERGFGIFISKVDKASKADEVGLRRGDQILEVNGQSFERVNHARALEILRGTTHLAITVKTNWLAFKEMLNTPENSPRPRKPAMDNIALLQTDPRSRFVPAHEWAEPVRPGQMRSSSLVPPTTTEKIIDQPLVNYDNSTSKDIQKGFMTIGHRRGKFKKVLAKISMISKSLNHESHLNSSDDSLYSSQSGGSRGATTRGASPQRGGIVLFHSQSNPDLTLVECGEGLIDTFPEHVLKVYRRGGGATDQTCKYLLVHRETTAHEVVMLTLREFGITDPSSDYCLCEVSVGEGGMVKQRRLPEHLPNLAERISLASRYYLKNNKSTEPLVPDELASELSRETQVHLLHLNSVELAAQLTLEDFTIFRQIEPTEYIDDLFELKQSKYGIPMLSRFAELVNKEMFWVVTEVCSEPNASLRMKIIKQFIKVARHCKECRNYNSLFAILSGLGHGAVSRLRQTWEKLPTKYMKMFEDLQDLMDPSRNMFKYRSIINSEINCPPVIPFYPVARKDMTFIHLGNDTKINGLVNFEKLRMIAKEVRQLMTMCSAPYDLVNLLELHGGPQLTSAMASLNSNATMSQAATVRRRKKSVTQVNPKKMFEEAQMVRRVKAYLSSLKIIADEDKLHILSIECETAGGFNGAPSATTAPVRRRHPSPTLSSASSTSITSENKKPLHNNPKFGTVSPQAVRKLLSLADQTKVRPRQQTAPRHHHSLSPSPSPGPLRRGPHESRHHGRSHSDTVTQKPVDLNAESSSVTSLSQHNQLRKSQTSGSVTSADSGHYDSHSNSSAGSNHSPLSRHYPRHIEMDSTAGGPYTTSIHVAPPKVYNNYHHPPDNMTITFKVGQPNNRVINFFDPDDDDDDEGKEAAV